MITHTSINYKSFSLQERENYLLSLDSTLQRRSIVLATCNRVEIYQGEGLVNEATVRHLFELTSGLKSRLIGETGIQGQVKQAYLKAMKHNCFDRNLHKLFQTAICVGKKVRVETEISKGAMSHSQATIEFIEKLDFNIRGMTFALFGVNNLNETILQYLQKKGVRSVFIGNRNLEKASEMAQNFSFGTFQFSQKKQIIREADVVISATSAPHAIINPEDIDERQKPLILFDLAVPRDVDPRIGKIGNVNLYNIEHIENQIDKNIEKRKMCIERAIQLVEFEVEKFMELQKKRFEHGRKDTENSVAA